MNHHDVKFNSYRGLKQGCPLSPLFFALYISDLDTVLERNQLGGVLVGRKKIFCLAFADDIILMAYTAAELKDMVRAMQRFAVRRQLVINPEKSKVMTFSKGSRSSVVNWTVGEHSFEEVDHFLYLGVVMQRNGSGATVPELILYKDANVFFIGYTDNNVRIRSNWV